MNIPSRNQEQWNCWEGLMDAERLEQRGLYEQIRFPEWQDRQEEEEEEEDSFDDPLPSLFLPLRLHLFLSSLEDSSELAKDLLQQVRSFIPIIFVLSSIFQHSSLCLSVVQSSLSLISQPFFPLPQSAASLHPIDAPLSAPLPDVAVADSSLSFLSQPSISGFQCLVASLGLDTSQLTSTGMSLSLSLSLSFLLSSTERLNLFIHHL